MSPVNSPPVVVVTPVTHVSKPLTVDQITVPFGWTE